MTDWSNMNWLNPPAHTSIDDEGVLQATSAETTDFWQVTHYGFQNDNGHALLRTATGEFSAGLSFDGNYQTLYDQAGMLLRVDAHHWVKFGVELTDEMTHLSVVVTRNAQSDWSAQPIALSGPVRLRATRIGDAIILQKQEGEYSWSMIRLLPDVADGGPVQVGPYLCSPQRAGFEARFDEFELTRPQMRELHS